MFPETEASLGFLVLNAPGIVNKGETWLKLFMKFNLKHTHHTTPPYCIVTQLGLRLPRRFAATDAQSLSPCGFAAAWSFGGWGGGVGGGGRGGGVGWVEGG